MFGNTGKSGRGGGGGGRGAPKRMPHNPSSLHPPHGLTGAARLPTTSTARNRSGGPHSGVQHVPEETFSLESNESPPFGMIIRVTPDLIEEMKRIEAQGGTTRIKFDSNSITTSGNVIDIGGKEFKFNCSRELGACDIYEERRSGEDGNGWLIESGSVWRKLTVQRILDESTKNHVKMRTEEAERKLKSRKAIVLDPANPSVKSQAKTMVAANIESNSRRMHWKQKEPAFKKRKVEPSPVSFSGPPKSVIKPGLSSKSTSNDRTSVSLPSPSDRVTFSASPLGIQNVSKGQTPTDEIIVPQSATKESASKYGKETPNRAAHVSAKEIKGQKLNIGAASTDLRSTLINLLSGSSKGMSLKALEKAVGDTHPNAGRKIEAIIKNIATFQAPGRYLLKPGVEIESSKKQSSDTGSSPDCVGNQTPLPESMFSEKTSAEELDRQIQLEHGPGEELNELGMTSAAQNSPVLFGSDSKAGNNSEGKAGSSSESGSDSDSDSDTSDSGSDSGSQSKSPAGTGSGSSSDSESDGSFSSKEGPDEEVDIMTSDDDKDDSDKNKLNVHIASSGRSALEVEKVDDTTLDAVDITDGSPIENNIRIGENNEREVAANAKLEPFEAKPRSMNGPLASEKHRQPIPPHMLHNNSLFDDSKLERETIMQENIVSRGKSRKASDPKSPFHEKSLESAKRVKSGSALPDAYRNNALPANDKGSKAYGAVPQIQIDTDQSDKRISDVNARENAPDIVQRPGKSKENLNRATKHSERSFCFSNELNGSASKSVHLQNTFQMQKEKVHREMPGEDRNAFEKLSVRSLRESSIEEKAPGLSDSQSRKCEDHVEKFKNDAQIRELNSRIMLDDNKSDFNRGIALRRELSDLEMGEFREPVHEDTHRVKQPFERKNSLKSSEKNCVSSDNPINEFGKGRSVGKPGLESNLSPSNHRVGGYSNQNALFGKKVPEDDPNDLTKSQRFIPTQAQDFSRGDRVEAEVGSHSDKLTDLAGKGKKNEAKENQGSTPEINMKVRQIDPKNEAHLNANNFVKEAKVQKSNAMMELADRTNHCFWMDGNANGGMRRESSSDEDNSFYSKYEKDKPELRGAIKDHPQYKEYVEEYKTKYGHYCSLNTTLENNRSEFLKLGRELDLLKGRDMDAYYKIQEQIKDTYRQCGTNHKRLKNIFIVLHEELMHLKQRIKDFAEEYAKS